MNYKRLKIKDKVFLLDIDDYEKFKDIPWCLAGTKRNYATTHLVVKPYRKFSLYLHREIMGLKEGDKRMVDHINHNTFDNRKKNLRVCTASQNQHNQDIRKHKKSSKYKGVVWVKRAQKWQARIDINGQAIHLGAYINEKDAARAYNEKARELHKEFAVLNKI